MDTMLTERRRMVTEAERALLMARLREGLLTRPEIVFAYLHGSFVTGRPFHDVDVAVWAEGISKERAWDYETQLSIALTRALGVEVDVRLLNLAPIGFCLAAANGILLFSRDENLRCDFLERIGRIYMDFAWLAREMLRGALR
jgi:predicted nucleotidyltransferase